MKTCSRGCAQPIYCRQLCRPCYRREPDQRAKAKATLNKYRASNDKHRNRERLRYHQEPEKLKARGRAHRAANHEAVRAREQRYHEANPDRVRVYYQKNKPALLAYAAAYRAANKEQRAMLQRHRIARQAQAPGSFTLAEWQALCEQYQHRCAACGQKKKLTVDHVQPISKGGSNSIDNLQPLCRPCNSSKHDRHIRYPAHWRGDGPMNVRPTKLADRDLKGNE